MIDSQLYADYLDGSLNEEAEHNFIQKFAYDSEFRDGFKSFIAVTNTIEKNKSSFGVSPSETSAIFAAISAAYPVAAPVITNSIPFWKSNLSKYIYSGILSSVATFVVLYFLWDNYSNTTQINNYSLNESKPAKVELNLKENLPTNTNTNKTIIKYVYLEKKVPQSKSNESENLVENNTPTDKNDTQFNDKKLVDGNSSDISKLESNDEIKSSKIYQNNNLIGTNNFVKYGFSERPAANIKLPSNFRLELVNTPSWFAEQTKIEPSTENKFNNFGVTLAYDFSDKFTLGANIKLETFYLSYSENDGTNEYMIYQHPNLVTYGLNFKYSPIKFFDNINTFLKLDVGANKTGMVLREGFGLEYLITDNTYFTLGYDYNQYIFSHQNKVYQNSKNSFIYGIGIKL